MCLQYIRKYCLRCQTNYHIWSKYNGNIDVWDCWCSDYTTRGCPITKCLPTSGQQFNIFSECTYHKDYIECECIAPVQVTAVQEFGVHKCKKRDFEPGDTCEMCNWQQTIVHCMKSMYYFNICFILWNTNYIKYIFYYYLFIGKRGAVYIRTYPPSQETEQAWADTENTPYV